MWQHDRLRKKLRRWNLEALPGRVAERSATMFQRLSTLVPLQVHASLVRTIWNGRCTRRRFQEHGPCVFRCSDTAADAIEHYEFRPLFIRLCTEFLHFPRITTLQEFMLIHHRAWSDYRLTVATATFNYARLHGPQDMEHLLDFAQRSCYHAVRSHGRSAAFFNAAVG